MYTVHVSPLESLNCVCCSANHSLIDVTFILDFLFPFCGMNQIYYSINWNRHYAFRFESFIIENLVRDPRSMLFYSKRIYYTIHVYNIHSFIYLFLFFPVWFRSFRNRRTSLYDYSILKSNYNWKTLYFSKSFLFFGFPFTTITYQPPTTTNRIERWW